MLLRGVWQAWRVYTSAGDVDRVVDVVSIQLKLTMGKI